MRIHLGHLLLLLSLTSGASAQQDQWQNIVAIKPNAKVEVIDQHLKRYSGSFVGSSDVAITLKDHDQRFVIQRADVYRVTVIHEKRFRNVLIGTAAGFAAGAALGAAIMEREQCYGCAVAGTGVGFAAIGAGVGAILPSSRTVYRAAVAQDRSK